MKINFKILYSITQNWGTERNTLPLGIAFLMFQCWAENAHCEASRCPRILLGMQELKSSKPQSMSANTMNARSWKSWHSA